MEEDKKLQAAVCVVAIVALVLLVVQYAGSRPGSKSSSGPGWYSRISPFGSSRGNGPAPGDGAPELAAPERVMTNAATRLFSSPTSAGSSGGLAGAEPAAPAEAAMSAEMNAQRLAGGGYVDLPSGSRAPTAGGGASLGTSPGAGSGPPEPTGGGPRSGFAGGAGPGADARSGKSPGGETAAAAGAGTAFGDAARSSMAKIGSPGAGGGPGGSAAPAFAGGLNAAPTLSPSGAPDAGGGDPGGGAGKGGGMSGKAPDAKPKESAGKPAGADTSAGAGGAGGGPNASGPPGEITSPATTIGTPQVGTVTVNGGMFRLRPTGPQEVRTTTFVTGTGAKVVKFMAKMAIDADGAGGSWRGDRTGQPETALQYKGQVSLDPRKLPFIVVPTDFGKTHPGVRLGDYATVSYGSKSLYAIVGDKGPPGVLGEASISVAEGFGIDANPNTGGTQRKEVEYAILEGSADPEPPRDAATVQARGKSKFDAAGAPVR